jgi:hypothetical protein
MDLEARARLLRSGSLSADLLEERARSLLGYADPKDYVIRVKRSSDGRILTSESAAGRASGSSDPGSILTDMTSSVSFAEPTTFRREMLSGLKAAMKIGQGDLNGAYAQG